jgi:hypothetical protein
VLHGALDRMEELRSRRARHRADHAAGHQEAEGVDRVARVRHEDDVARRGDRLGDVGEALLGAEGGDDLRVGIELHAEAARIVARLRLAQAGDAFGGGIAVGARLPRRLDELLDDVLGGRQVRIAHAEVDDVGVGLAGGGLHTVHLLEHVRRQPSNRVEVLHRPVPSRGCAAYRLSASRGKRAFPAATAVTEPCLVD